MTASTELYQMGGTDKTGLMASIFLQEHANRNHVLHSNNYKYWLGARVCLLVETGD